MKFIVDSMHGSLARFLRILGYDTLYFTNSSDERLARRAFLEDRILLTADLDLYRSALSRGVEALLIEGKTLAHQLACVAQRFNIELEVNPSLCSICNSPIRPVSKNLIKDRVPSKTLEVYDRFYKCENDKCQKIYWFGSHMKGINKILAQARQILKSKSHSSF